MSTTYPTHKLQSQAPCVKLVSEEHTHPKIAIGWVISNIKTNMTYQVYQYNHIKGAINII